MQARTLEIYAQLDVQWNTELVDLAHTAEHASATLKQSDGSMLQINARWIAGGDGPHSMVRSLSKIDFPGAQARQHHGVC